MSIKKVAHKNGMQSNTYREKYPRVADVRNKEHESYMKMLRGSFWGSTDEIINQNFGKIISNIAKESTIDKELVRNGFF